MKFWICRDLSNRPPDTYIWMFSSKKKAMARYLRHKKAQKKKKVFLSELGKPILRTEEWIFKNYEKVSERSTDRYFAKKEGMLKIKSA